MRRYLPAVALSFSTIAMAVEPTADELKARIDALEKKVASMEQKQANAADVDAVVERMLKDAHGRSQLMQAEGFTAGYHNGKFTIQSADGNFSFSPTAQLQGRYVGNWNDAGDDSNYTDGFELRRVKFGFVGNAVTPDLTYKFQWATTRNVSSSGDAGGTPILEEAWARYRFGEHFALFGGQFEDLTSHESMVSAGKQLAAEQSFANKALIDSASEHAQGIGGTYETNKWRISAAYTDGFNSRNTDFRDQAFLGETVHWGASARGEVMVLGDKWKQYDDFTAFGNTSDLLVLGGGAAYSEIGGSDGVVWSLDAQWEPEMVSGLSVFGALLGQQVDAGDISSTGWLIQAGYMLTSKWEVFGRFDYTSLDSAVVPAGAENDVQEYTAGVNYYINGHAMKLTADLSYLPDGAPADTALGVTEGDESQFVARVQFQLLL